MDPRLPESWLAKIEPIPISGCWVWLGALTHNGYGHSSQGRVHRVVYELLVGEIGPGLTLDHLCCVRPCCNPAHLDPVPAATNNARSTSPSAEHARKLACPRCGGPYWVEPSTGKRRCKPCRAAWARGRARKSA